MSDCFSKYVETYAITKIDSPTVSEMFVNNFVFRFGEQIKAVLHYKPLEQVKESEKTEEVKDIVINIQQLYPNQRPLQSYPGYVQFEDDIGRDVTDNDTSDEDGPHLNIYITHLL
ncbi:hypothetical protein RF11_16329 [Thelohanellus kitauei]|uniref:Uncharacterized protein n=1 Tax=Thelohanellus kitauei TaxID=669202 RepID=A0A0C2MLW3_THEKT|nr:hypothetical protein RF11_16329 [Thelohanellus kitauei]